MEQEVIHHMLEKQREFFRSGVTLPPIYRIEHLRRLRETICANEEKITEALKSDLGKSGFESYMCEVGLVLEEIRYMLKYACGLSKPRSVSTPLHQFAAKSYIQPEPYGNVLIMSPWNYPFLLTMKYACGLSKPRSVSTPLHQFAAKSYIQPEPYGNVLIMSPWNYPFLLTIGPLVDALAAGNTVVIKPSAYSPATSRVIQELVEACFDPAYVAVVTGGRAENQALLEEKFQYIFFTGSQSVGKVVMEKAAQHLTPVTLELGGKSPCIVDETADLKLAARRIVFGKFLNCGQTCVAPDYVWVHESVKEPLISPCIVDETADLKLAARRIVFGKFLNCGQTCVAPDYVWVHESVKEPLIRLIFEQIRVQYGEHPLENPNYGKIISARHFERLLSLIDPKKVVMGGTWDAQRQKIAPTVLDSVTWEDAVMGQEIFGPVLPIMTFTELEDVISQRSLPRFWTRSHGRMQSWDKRFSVRCCPL